MKELLRKYTAGPGDGKATRFKIVTRRLAFYKDVLEDLEKVDEDVMRTLTVICSKGAMRTRETVALKTLSVRVEHANAELARIIPHRLPDAAPIPAEAPTFPDCYVQRKHLLDALVDELVSTAVATQPISLVGIGGAGKSILASAIVQHWKVRECYRRGIFWIRAGQRGKDRLVELLQKLVLDLGVAPADVPEQFDANLSDLIVLLDAVATDASSPCLVVLDDVWESEVVETLRQTGLPLLVTTRHASILGSWRRLEEVDRMSEDEAYQVLLKASSIHMSPGEEVTRVIRHVSFPHQDGLVGRGSPRDSQTVSVSFAEKQTMTGKLSRQGSFSRNCTRYIPGACFAACPFWTTRHHARHARICSRGDSRE